MRISDWSSDVCSSDLTGCLAEGHCRHRSPGRRSAVSCHIGRTTARGLRGSTRGRRQWRWRPVWLVRVHWARSRDERRSEEHTSELQSLMRISYAVFCLKKKNETKKNNQRLEQNHEQSTARIKEQT